MNPFFLVGNMLCAVLGPTAIAVMWPLPQLIILCTAAQIESLTRFGRRRALIHIIAIVMKEQKNFVA